MLSSVFLKILKNLKDLWKVQIIEGPQIQHEVCDDWGKREVPIDHIVSPSSFSGNQQPHVDELAGRWVSGVPLQGVGSMQLVLGEDCLHLTWKADHLEHHLILFTFRNVAIVPPPGRPLDQP